MCRNESFPQDKQRNLISNIFALPKSYECKMHRIFEFRNVNSQDPNGNRMPPWGWNLFCTSGTPDRGAHVLPLMLNFAIQARAGVILKLTDWKFDFDLGCSRFHPQGWFFHPCLLFYCGQNPNWFVIMLKMQRILFILFSSEFYFACDKK